MCAGWRVLKGGSGDRDVRWSGGGSGGGVWMGALGDRMASMPVGKPGEQM